LGTIGTEAVTRMVRERDYSEMSAVMQQAIADVYDAFSRKHDPQEVDLILDRAYYNQFAADIKEIDNPFLHKLADIIIDTTNIKMYIRAKTLGKAWDFISRLLVDGGTIPYKTYIENSDKPVESFVEDIRSSNYGETAEKGWEMYKATNNISGLEKMLDDYIMKFVQEAKLVTMGVEPLIAWLFAKEAEIRNVRIIMTGRINRLPVDSIRERLRLGYV